MDLSFHTAFPSFKLTSSPRQHDIPIRTQKNLERVTSSTKFLTVFLTGRILSFILSVSFYQLDVLMLGASAAIFSVASAVMLIEVLQEEL